MGYYGGNGARSMATLGPFEGEVQPEPATAPHSSSRRRWRPSFEIPIEGRLAERRLPRQADDPGQGYQSYLIWVVRDDRHADLMFQVLRPDLAGLQPLARRALPLRPGRTTPGTRNAQRRASASIGRTGSTTTSCRRTSSRRRNGSGEFLLWEFPLAYWLERNGYDVTYASELDTHRDADGLLRVKGFLSVGHDEYWSRRMFDNVARARDAGVSLAFLTRQRRRRRDLDRAVHRWTSERIFQRAPGRPASNEFDDEHTLMGSTSYGVGLGDWIVREPEHWLLSGTGMQLGDRIPGLVGWEYHGAPLRDDPSLVVLRQRQGLRSPRRGADAGVRRDDLRRPAR